MKKQSISKEAVVSGIIGLLVGTVITGFAAGYAVNNEHQGMMRMMGMHAEKVWSQQTAMNHSEMSMAEMTEQLKNKKGDDFDAAFIEMMIAHHQGAIDMAKLIPDRAKHEEVKKLGENIIEAQTGEISDMYKWQSQWGYATNQYNQMMHHGQ